MGLTLFQSPFNEEIFKMRESGLLQKMLDHGRYLAYGRNPKIYKEGWTIGEDTLMLDQARL